MGEGKGWWGCWDVAGGHVEVFVLSGELKKGGFIARVD